MSAAMQELVDGDDYRDMLGICTNPEGPYRLQPERVRFHPDDDDDDDDDYIYSFYRTSSHIITTCNISTN